MVPFRPRWPLSEIARGPFRPERKKPLVTARQSRVAWRTKGAIMKASLNPLAHASVWAVFLAASIAAGAGEASVKVAVTETSAQTAGPAGVQPRPPRELQVAQCRSGGDDCLTRPQAYCSPGLDDCLARGQSDCRNVAASAGGPGPNTAGLDNALKNPNLAAEVRARLEQTRSNLLAASQRGAASTARARYAQCLQRITVECRAEQC
jgi:hypothetical protein